MYHHSLLSIWYATTVHLNPTLKKNFEQLIRLIKVSSTDDSAMTLNQLELTHRLDKTGPEFDKALGQIVWELLGVLLMEKLYLGPYYLILYRTFDCYGLCRCGSFGIQFLNTIEKRMSDLMTISPKILLYCCHESSKISILNTSTFTNQIIGLPMEYIFSPRNEEWPMKFEDNETEILDKCVKQNIGLPCDIFETNWNSKHNGYIMKLAKRYPPSMYKQGQPTSLYNNILSDKHHLYLVLLYISIWKYTDKFNNNLIDWHQELADVSQSLLNLKSIGHVARDKLMWFVLLNQKPILRWGALINIILAEETDGAMGLYDFIQEVLHRLA